jgi:hypothetical protein
MQIDAFSSYRIKMGRIENAEMAGNGCSRLFFITGTDGRTQSPIIEFSYRWPDAKWLGIPEMPKCA